MFKGHSELMHADTILMAGGAVYFFIFNDFIGLIGVAVGFFLHLSMQGGL